jgi:ketosteroid isomerase-like protein
MSAENNNEVLIRALYDAVNRKDLEMIAAYGSPESEWVRLLSGAFDGSDSDHLTI